MKVLKLTILSILVSLSFFIVPILRAETTNLEIYYFGDSETYELTTLRIHDLDTFEYYDFTSEEYLINDVVWLKFTLVDIELINTNYQLILTIDEYVKVYPFTLDEPFKTETLYQYYLRGSNLTSNTEALTSLVSYATFIDGKNIKVVTSAKSTGVPTIKVQSNDVFSEVKSIKDLVDGYLIELEDDLDVKREYTLDFDFNDGFGYQRVNVRLDGIYNQGFFESAYHYDSNDLGSTYTKSRTTFKLWAPTLNSVKLNLYSEGTKTVFDMQPSAYGVYVFTFIGDAKNRSYTYSFERFGVEYEIVDPYSKHLSSDLTKSLVVALDETNPSDFTSIELPYFSGSYGDAVIYETSIHQMTGDPLSNGTYKDTYVGLSRSNTTYEYKDTEYTTGIAHLKELGITHVALSDLLDTKNSLSVINRAFQFDQSITKDIYEVKNLIKAMANNGIRVILDIDLYNPVIEGLELLMPGYYYEQTNGEIIKNENKEAFFNTDHSMTSRYIESSLAYLLEEYKLSALKISPLNGLMIDDLNKIQRLGTALDEDFLMYGEFNSYTSKPLTGKLTKQALDQVKFVGVIDQSLNTSENAWVKGGSLGAQTKRNILSSSTPEFNNLTPHQMFNRLPDMSNLTYSERQQYKALYLLSFSTPVIRGGEEFNNTSSVLKYQNKENNQTFKMYKDLIDFRFNHLSIKLPEHREIKSMVNIQSDANLIYYRITNQYDLYPDILIIHHNSVNNSTSFTLPEGLPGETSSYNIDGDFYWKVAFDSSYGLEIDSAYENGDSINLIPNQTLVLYYGLNLNNAIVPPVPNIPDSPSNSNQTLIALIMVGSLIIVAGIIGTYFILRTSKDEQ